MTRPKLRKAPSTKRKKKQKATEKALQQRTSMLLDMPEVCCVCDTAFDKKSREMAQTWHVVVFEERKIVRLTCPPCWESVEKTMEETNAT